MKRIKMAALAAGMLLTFTVSAQQEKKEMHRGYNPEQVAEKMTQRMAKSLELTPEQVEQVHEANLKMAQKRQENHEEMKAYREQHKATMQKVLTEEQWEKHQQQRKALKGKAKQRREKMQKQ